LDVCGGFVITTIESKIVVLPQKSGALLFQLTQGNQDKVDESCLLEQFDHQSWFCNDDINTIFHRCSVRSAFQVGLSFMALIVEEPPEQPNRQRMVIVFDVKSPLSPCSIIKKFPLSSLNGSLLSVSVAESTSIMTEKKMTVFCILYEKGGTVCTLKVAEDSLSTVVEFREEQVNAFKDDQIVAMDAFVCQSSLFSKRQRLKEQNMDESEWDSDDDDVFIYEQASAAKTKQTSNALASLISTVMKNDIRESSDIGNGCNTVHVAFCR
jgi:hypothetical protein